MNLSDTPFAEKKFMTVNGQRAAYIDEGEGDLPCAQALFPCNARRSGSRPEPGRFLSDFLQSRRNAGGCRRAGSRAGT